MFRWSIPGVAASVLFLGPPAFAQAPPIPGAPAAAAAVPGAPAAVGAATGAAAAPSNIWSKLCMTPEQKQACKQKFCSIPLVPFLGGVLSPVRAVSGGLLPSCCPGPLQPNPADLLKPADSAEGAASRIKQKELEAKARRAAVRYLGTVDCRRYPEAEAALINALLTDENECVRYEAALALANGCCCTKKVLEALVQLVSCRKGNHPIETSPRVKFIASLALERCLCRYAEIDAMKPPEKPAEPASPAPEKLPPPAGSGPEKLPAPLPEEKAASAGRIAPDPQIEDARRVLAWYKQQQARLTAAPSRTPAATPEPALLVPVSERTAAPRTMAQAFPASPVVSEPAAAAPAAGSSLPPTGQRDLWTLLMRSVQR